jgi:hypothetical protein
MSRQPSASTIVHAGGPSPTLRQLLSEIGDVATSLPFFLTAPLYRGWHKRWGATDGEVESAMPADDVIPNCKYVITRAITIDAPPRVVWPWLLQIGFGKAGFYSNDLLDNAGHPSAERVLGNLQRPRVGDWVPMFMKVNEATAFHIAAIAWNECLVWAKPDSTWVWMLTPAGKGTRLVTRLRIRYQWESPVMAILSVLLNEFADFAMMRRMLLGIKRRAERVAAGRRSLARLIRAMPGLVAAGKNTPT